MDTKKDIGHFFKERLNQMDFTPNEEGWNKIEIELTQKKRKRRAFFWMYFSAFLAGSIMTLLFVYATNSFEKGNLIQSEAGTTVTRATPNQNSNRTNDRVPNSESSIKQEKSINITNENRTTNKDIAPNQWNERNLNNTVSNENKSEGNRISNTSKSIEIKSKKHKSKKYKKAYYTSNSNYKFSQNNERNLSQNKPKRNLKGLANSKQNSNHLVKTNSNPFDLENSTTILSAKNSDNAYLIEIDSNTIEKSKTVIQDTILLANNVTPETKKTEVKSETDTLKKTPEESLRFSIIPYFGIGLQAKNQVSGNFNATKNLNSINTHYGIGFRWMTSKKFGLQTGLGYINSSTKTEIEKTNSNTLVLNNVNNNSNITFPSSNKLRLTHDFSRYEIPLEGYYKLQDKKIGFAIASGFSYTLIKNNSVHITTASENINLGSLQNTMNQNFTINFKVYSTYKFTDKIQFELYPSLQYEFLNSGKKSDSNPINLSIRAGLNYQF